MEEMLRAENSRLYREARGLQAQLSAAVRSAEHHCAAAATATAERDEVMRTLEAVSQQLQEERRKGFTGVALLKERQENVAALSAQVKRLQAQLDERLRQPAALSLAQAQVTARSQSMHTSLADASARISKLEEEVARWRDRAHSLERELGDAQAAADEATAACSREANARHVVEQSLDEHKTQCRSHTRQLRAERTEKERCQAAFQTFKASAQASRQEYEAAAHDEAVRMAQETVTSLEGAHAKQTRTLEATISRLTAELAASHKALSSRGSAVRQDLASARRAAKRADKALASQTEALRKATKEAEHRQRQLKDQEAAHASELREAERRCQAEREAKLEHARQLKDRDAEIARLQAQIVEAEAAATERDRKMRRLRESDRADAEARVKEAQMEMDRLRHEHAHVHKALELERSREKELLKLELDAKDKAGASAAAAARQAAIDLQRAESARLAAERKAAEALEARRTSRSSMSWEGEHVDHGREAASGVGPRDAWTSRGTSGETGPPGPRPRSRHHRPEYRHRSDHETSSDKKAVEVVDPQTGTRRLAQAVTVVAPDGTLGTSWMLIPPSNPTAASGAVPTHGTGHGTASWPGDAAHLHLLTSALKRTLIGTHRHRHRRRRRSSRRKTRPPSPTHATETLAVSRRCLSGTDAKGDPAAIKSGNDGVTAAGGSAALSSTFLLRPRPGEMELPLSVERSPNGDLVATCRRQHCLRRFNVNDNSSTNQCGFHPVAPAVSFDGDYYPCCGVLVRPGAGNVYCQFRPHLA